MYDRETESLWSQIARRAVTGPLRGKELRQIPLLHTTWERWREDHPRGFVLSRKTGHHRDYDTNPYLSYGRNARVMFPVRHEDGRLGTKDLVLGIERARGAKAYPFARLAGEPSPIRDRIGGEELFVYFDRDSETAFATDLAGRELPTTVAYWFAWSAFHPGTELWNERAGPQTGEP
ncbi:MAG: DUF3179 domain-containing (seleno)protein, partial [Gemmatimonadota bacterium]